MSSTLAMILTAAMAVPGNGPEMVSAEMEERLDLSGKWEGKWTDGNSKLDLDVILDTGRLRAVGIRVIAHTTDEGGGHLRFTWYDKSIRHGIYKQDGDRLIICIGTLSGGRRWECRAGDGQELLILHRVKPRK